MKIKKIILWTIEIILFILMIYITLKCSLFNPLETPICFYRYKISIPLIIIFLINSVAIILD